MSFRGVGLAAKDVNGSSDPFLKVTFPFLLAFHTESFSSGFCRDRDLPSRNCQDRPRQEVAQSCRLISLCNDPVFEFFLSLHFCFFFLSFFLSWRYINMVISYFVFPKVWTERTDNKLVVGSQVDFQCWDWDKLSSDDWMGKKPPRAVESLIQLLLL